MKQYIFFLVLITLLWGCSKGFEGNNPASTTSLLELRTNQEEVNGEEYGEIMILGDEKINPYSVRNMQNAAQDLSAQFGLPKKTIISNAIYLRVLPADSTEYALLKETPFEWFDYPLDREIIKYGEMYKDPTLPQDAAFGWLYTTVYDRQKNHLQKLIQVSPNLRVEVLDFCYIPEVADDYSLSEEAEDGVFIINNNKQKGLLEATILSAAKASTESSEYNNLLEIRAFQQSGLFSEELNNASPLSLAFWGGGKRPKGSIKVHENALIPDTIINPVNENDTTFTTKIRHQDVPVKGVKMRVSLFVKWDVDITDDEGEYEMSQKFRINPLYTVVFENRNDFSIYKGINLLFVARDIKGVKSRSGYNVVYDNSHLYWRDATINNAAEEYYALCKKHKIPLPPRDLKIWQWSQVIGNSAPMLRHLGKISDGGTPLEVIVNGLIWNSETHSYLLRAIKSLLPDITINCPYNETHYFTNIVSHELSHASHFSRVGSGYWLSYIKHIIENDGYGEGAGPQAGICAVGEMWGFAIGNYTEQNKYNRNLNKKGPKWIHPKIIYNLIQPKPDSLAILSPGEVARALTSEIRSVQALKEKLTRLYPSKKSKIDEIFTLQTKQ